MDYQFYKQTIEAINKIGFSIIHIPEENTTLIPTEVKEYSPSDNRFNTIIRGRDISNKMDGFKNTIHDINGIKTLIESVNIYEYKWSYNVKYKEFVAR